MTRGQPSGSRAANDGGSGTLKTGHRIFLPCGAALLLLNLQFYLLFLLFSLVAIPGLTLTVAILAIFLSHRRTMRYFRMAIRWYGWVIMHMPGFPWIRVGCRNLGDGSVPGPFLFICNHRSASDPFLMACIPEEGIQLVNIWPLRLPVLGPYAKGAGYLSINEMDVEAFYAQGRKLLGEGVSMVSFPEGHRSTGPEMLPFHSSIFRLALQTRASLVPLCISGNERIPPKGSLLLRPGLIRIDRLPPVPWAEYKDLDAFHLKKKIRDLMSSHLAEMEGRPTDRTNGEPAGEAKEEPTD